VVIGASQLNSDYDVIMYRAMQGVLEEAQGKKNKYDKSGNLVGPDWEKYQKLGSPNDYLAVSQGLDLGLSPELLDRAMGIVEKQLAGGDKTETIIQAMHLFGLNATSAREVYDAVKAGNLDKAKAVATDPKNAGSSEQRLLTATEGIRLDLANIGSSITNYKGQALELLQGILGGIAGSKMFETYKIQLGDTLGNFFGDNSKGENNRIQGLMKKALNAQNQPDLDNNGLGDYGETVGHIQMSMRALPPGQEAYLRTHPELYNELFKTIKSEKDFTPEFARGFDARLSAMPNFQKVPESYVKALGLGKGTEEAYARGDPYMMAIIGSIKDTYNNSIDAFKGSGQYGPLKDDLAHKSPEQVYENYLKNYHRPGAASDPYTDPNASGMALLQEQYSVNPYAFEGGKKHKAQDAVAELIREYSGYLQYGAVNPILQKYRSPAEGDKKPTISEAEAVLIFREISKQLSELGSSLPKALRDALELKIRVVEGQ
jgi:hypothetical protein